MLFQSAVRLVLSIHELGWAKQFLIYGDFEGSITWTAGDYVTDEAIYSQVLDDMKEMMGAYWGLYNEFNTYLENYHRYPYSCDYKDF